MGYPPIPSSIFIRAVLLRVQAVFQRSLIPCGRQFSESAFALPEPNWLPVMKRFGSSLAAKFRTIGARKRHHRQLNSVEIESGPGNALS